MQHAGHVDEIKTAADRGGLGDVGLGEFDIVKAERAGHPLGGAADAIGAGRSAPRFLYQLGLRSQRYADQTGLVLQQQLDPILLLIRYSA